MDDSIANCKVIEIKSIDRSRTFFFLLRIKGSFLVCDIFESNNQSGIQKIQLNKQATAELTAVALANESIETYTIW